MNEATIKQCFLCGCKVGLAQRRVHNNRVLICGDCLANRLWWDEVINQLVIQQNQKDREQDKPAAPAP